MTSNEFYEAMRDGARLIYVEEHEVLVRPLTAKGELVPQSIRRSKNFKLFTGGYYISYCDGKTDVNLNLLEDGTVRVSGINEWQKPSGEMGIIDTTKDKDGVSLEAK
jgi:hypothetical protein